MPRIVGIIQARMSSSRLSGKVLMPLRENELVLDSVYRRIKRSSIVDEVVIATSVHDTDDSIEEHCKKMGYPYKRGSLEDVLERYYSVAKEYKAEIVVRVTADCPLIDYKLNDMLIKYYIDNKLDFAGIDQGSLAHGLSSEVFSFNALEKAHKEAQGKHREHVTSYIYENSDIFGCLRMHAPAIYQDTRQYRLTLDRIEDYKVLKAIFESKVDYIEIKDVLRFLCNNPEIAAINARI